MPKPTDNFTNLWNDLPFAERDRLAPYLIETQKLHIWQCKMKAISLHKKHMKELDDWMNNLDAELRRL